MMHIFQCGLHRFLCILRQGSGGQEEGSEYPMSNTEPQNFEVNLDIGYSVLDILRFNSFLPLLLKKLIDL